MIDAWEIKMALGSFLWLAVFLLPVLAEKWSRRKYAVPEPKVKEYDIHIKVEEK